MKRQFGFGLRSWLRDLQVPLRLALQINFDVGKLHMFLEYLSRTRAVPCARNKTARWTAQVELIGELMCLVCGGVCHYSQSSSHLRPSKVMRRKYTPKL